MIHCFRPARLGLILAILVTKSTHDALAEGGLRAHVHRVLGVTRLDGVVDVDFASDTNRVAAGFYGGGVGVWTSEGEQLHRIASAHDSALSAALSPDGRLVATSGADQSVAVWSVETGKELARARFDAPVLLGFFADGKGIVAAPAGRRELSILRAPSLEVATTIEPFEGHVLDVATAAGAPRYAVSGVDGTLRRVSVHVRELNTAEPLRVVADEQLELGKRPVALSSDGTLLACGAPKSIVVIDVESGERVVTLAHEAFLDQHFAFSGDGHMLVAVGGYLPRYVESWEIPSGSLRRRFQLPQPFVGQLRVAPSRDGGVAVVGGSAALGRFDLSTGKLVTQFFGKGHLASVKAVAYAPDGRTLATASEDLTVGLWHIAGGDLVQTLTHGYAVSGVAFSPDGQRLASAGGPYVRIWSLGSSPRQLRSMQHDRWAWSVAFSPDGERVVSGGIDGSARLWSASTGTELRRCEGHRDDVLHVAFASTGAVFASGGRKGEVCLWETSTGRMLATGSPGKTVRGLAFSPSGATLAAVAHDGSLQLWDVASAKLATTIETGNGYTHGLAFAGERFVICGGRRALFLVDLDTGRSESVSLEKGRYLQNVTVSPSGDTVTTSQGDGTAIVWRIAP